MSLVRLAVGIILLTTGACSLREREPRSAIVEQVQDAGAGDLSHATQESIQLWLGKRKELAYQIDEMCKPLRAKATAQWAQTTEGRVCAAARTLAFFRSAPVEGDGVGYKATQ